MGEQGAAVTPRSALLGEGRCGSPAVGVGTVLGAAGAAAAVIPLLGRGLGGSRVALAVPTTCAQRWVLLGAGTPGARTQTLTSCALSP